MVECKNQDEVDYFWERLTDAGEESQCGWLKGRFGLSWQVVQTGMDALFSDADPERARRAMAAMFGMGKLDIAAMLEAADCGADRVSGPRADAPRRTPEGAPRCPLPCHSGRAALSRGPHVLD